MLVNADYVTLITPGDRRVVLYVLDHADPMVANFPTNDERDAFIETLTQPNKENQS